MNKIFSSNAIVAYMALTLIFGIIWAFGAPFQIPTIIAAAATLLGFASRSEGDHDSGSGWFGGTDRDDFGGGHGHGGDIGDDGGGGDGGGGGD